MSNEVSPTTDGVEEALQEVVEERESQKPEDETIEAKKAELGEEVVEDEVVEETADEPTITVASMLQRINEGGNGLTDEMIAEAKENGLNPDSVELAYMKDQVRVQGAVKQAYEDAGGEDKFKAVQAWATDGGLSEDEAKEFNTALGDDSRRSLMIKGLVAMYDAQHKPEVKEEKADVRVKGQPRQSSTFVKGFKSLQEMQQHIKYMRKNPSDSDAQRTYDEKMKHSGALLRR